MKLPVLVTSAALADLNEAAQLYDELVPGLGGRFLASFGAHISPASAFPHSFPRYYRDLRKVGLRPFPFLALYRALPELVQVVAVIDARRDPKAIRRLIRTR